MFLNMLLEKKRTFYKCGDTYVTPESHDLIKWPVLCATATHKMKKCKTDRGNVLEVCLEVYHKNFAVHRVWQYPQNII